MHATFVAAGPGIVHSDVPVADVRAIDLAPTLAFLMNVPGPQNARGRIMYNLTGTGRYKEITILDISDYHGQIVPLTDAADNIANVTNQSFNIGGSAFLKPWFDVYRAEAQNGSITMAAGDSVGATPPISNFFGDTPTFPIMNMMGIQLDGLGNHNFDKGQAYLRNTLIPLANFPFISSNVVDAQGNTPAEWKPSVVFDTTFAGGKVGFVGFTNEDAPTLVFPGSFDPFHVAQRVPAVQGEVNRLRSKNVKTIIVIGHDGATAASGAASYFGGISGNPTGPLLDLADQLTGVDAVIGDHSDFQVISTRPNGVLVTENRSKGIRFTRVRLVLDTTTKKIVYKTPDAAIQAKIDQLNSDLAPILNPLVGYSTVIIPRADTCGQSAGRTCESLVGDVTADALRAAASATFAITNSGGLRADLTCPITDNASDFCPATLYPFAAGQFPITRGQVLGVLPFGNLVATVTVSGPELKTMLENGISRMPAVDGRFPQVSGLCFDFNIEAAVNSRVSNVRYANPDGTCTTNLVDLTVTAPTYFIAENDFMSTGGDGYPNFYFSGRVATLDYMDVKVTEYITAHSPISPVIQTRIHCVDPNPGVGNDCPVGSP
jgi:2',3'-cyclic-nucleotide 2'-phosphodiesterase (5'-nucleotidase family)